MKNYYLYFFLCFFSFSGCSVYTHQTVDIPLISKSNDVRLDGGISLKEAVFGTISMGITDRMALQAYFNRGLESRFFIQSSAGFYKNLGDKKILELYGGFGFGRTETGNHDIPTDLHGRYQLYFTQLNFGKLDCQFANMDFGLAVKTGYLHSNLVDINYFNTQHDHNPANFEHIPLKVESLLIEPAAFVRLGGEKLKISFKAGTCLRYQLTHKDRQLPIDRFNLGLGMNYKF